MSPSLPLVPDREQRELPVQVKRVAADAVADDHVAFVALGADIQGGGAAVGVDHLASAVVEDDHVPFVAGGTGVDHGIRALQPDHVPPGRVVHAHLAVVAERADCSPTHWRRER